LKLNGASDWQAQANPGTANTGKHFVIHKVGVKTVDLSATNARELEEYCIDLLFAAR
jgi:hypothetical protein